MNPISVFYTYYPFEQGVEWERCVRRAATAGADGIEISSMRLVREPWALCERIMEVAREVGIRTTFTTGLPEGCDASSADPEERTRAVRFIGENVRLVSRMGGKTVGGVFHGLNRLPRRMEYDEKQRRLDCAAQTLREAAKLAGDAGVTLADEAVNRFENAMINTVEEELAFLGRVDSPYVGALLDTFHMNIEERDIPAAILRARGRIAHVHLAENNRSMPGNGHMDWHGILAALKDAGYAGTLTLESFVVPYPAISDSMCIWRDVRSEGLDEDAARAIALLRGIQQALD